MTNFKLLFFTDDDRDDLQLLHEITHTLGHRAHLFTDGEAMFGELQSTNEKPHIIFLDISMPKADGFDIIETIRSYTEYNDIPIVIHSARCDTRCLDRAFELGANYYMTKAYTYEGVKQSIITAIETDWNTFKPKREEFLHKIS